MSPHGLHAACKALKGEAITKAHVVFSAIKDDLWAKRTRNLYVSFVHIYLQVLMASFLMGRKDLLSRPLEVGDTRPLDLKKQKIGEGPSNEVRQIQEKEVEGAEVDEDLDASLGNLLRQALEREKKLKEDVKRANERERELIAKMRQGIETEPEKNARLMEENKHLQI